MKTHLLITFILMISVSLKAQKSDTVLRFDKNTKTVYDGEVALDMDDLNMLMKPHPEAFKYISFARESRTFAKVFFYLGSFPLGFTLGYFLPTRTFLWKPFVVGVGLVGIGVPLHIRFLKKTQQAVKAFNGRNDETYNYRNSFELKFGLTQNGVGFSLRF